MRVVVDTNVFVSAALKSDSPPAWAVQAIADRATLLKSTATERQLLEVLARRHLAVLIAPKALVRLKELMQAAEHVLITERIVACRDPTDDKFLELAVNGRADLILSGDADLLVLDPFRGIPIVTPAAFLGPEAR